MSERCYTRFAREHRGSGRYERKGFFPPFTKLKTFFRPFGRAPRFYTPGVSINYVVYATSDRTPAAETLSLVVAAALCRRMRCGFTYGTGEIDCRPKSVSYAVNLAKVRLAAVEQSTRKHIAAVGNRTTRGAVN